MQKNALAIVFFILSQVVLAQNKRVSYQVGLMGGSMTQRNSQVDFLELQGVNLSLNHDFSLANNHCLRVGLGYELFTFVSNGYFQRNNANQWVFEQTPVSYQNNQHIISSTILPISYVYQKQRENTLYEIAAGGQLGYLLRTRHNYRIADEEFSNNISLEKRWRVALTLETGLTYLRENKKYHPKFSIGLNYQFITFADTGQSFAPVFAYIKGGFVL